MAKLSIVATPIGNREDISIRALKTLFSVDILLCEDTRKTQQLLAYYRETYVTSFNDIDFNHQPILISFFEHNEERRIDEIITYLNQGKEIGLVSNAGTPLLSDPGFKLVRTCRQQNISVTAIPGPSSITTSLAISGLPTDKFLFLGFLPKKTGKQTTIFEGIKNSGLEQTIILFESPFRIYKTLQLLQSIFGDIEIAIARELTKIHEEVIKQPISVYLTINKKYKGEMVVLFRP